MISDQIALHSVQLPLYILPKDKIILTKKVIHLLSISDDDLDDEAIQSEISSQVSWLEYDEDQSKYFGVVASVFHSHLVSRFFHFNNSPQLPVTAHSQVIIYSVSIWVSEHLIVVTCNKKCTLYHSTHL